MLVIKETISVRVTISQDLMDVKRLFGAPIAGIVPGKQRKIDGDKRGESLHSPR
jgi:hypothetical protein